MDLSSWSTKLLLALIILHFIVGFGYMIYKLSPRKGDKSSIENEKEDI